MIDDRMKPNSDLEKSLTAALEDMPVIDAHEHLGPEDNAAARTPDVFRLFSMWPYIGMDLERAGMPPEQYTSLLDPAQPLEQRWQRLAPFWEMVRHTGYARCIRLTAERLYGIPDINDATYLSLSEAMAVAGGPGLVRRVLRDACNIRVAINDAGSAVATDLYAPVVRVNVDCDSWSGLTSLSFAPSCRIATLDDLLDACRQYLIESKKSGAVGIKTVSLDYGEPDRAAALSLFADLKSGRKQRLAEPVQPFPFHLGPSHPLRDYIHDQIVRCAGELDLVVAVHAGYWGDFRHVSPLHLIPLLMRHPDVRFDLFHLGYPWIRESLMLAKGFSNVWINLCWVHMISQQAVVQALEEIFDLLPLNKILAFGGDFSKESVECVYGHLAMSRENIVRVLARRVQARQMTEDQAVEIARQWYWENPVKLYGLEMQTGAMG